MCTCFVHRRGDVLVGMNFDNNGMDYALSTKDANRFTVMVNGGRGKAPSFGVNSRGMFVNHLFVDSNGKGSYRRISAKVTHTGKLVKDVLDGTIPPDGIDVYLSGVEVVNVPDLSVHNMIVDGNGNAWVVEPGRGVIRSPREETPWFAMTNFSLWDYRATGVMGGSGADRYEIVGELLAGIREPGVADAFGVLEAAAQGSGEWVTAFSMVYSGRERVVYFCRDRDFGSIGEYRFE